MSSNSFSKYKKSYYYQSLHLDASYSGGRNLLPVCTLRAPKWAVKRNAQFLKAHPGKVDT